ncbi:MAG: hypothetical protein ABIY51_16090 [Ferruginibacter sp.]
MNIEVNFKVYPEYLLVESKGEIKNENDLRERCKMIFDGILRHDKNKVLINEPGTRFPKRILMYYNLVDFYIHNFPPHIRSLKIAKVLSEEYKEIGYFWETVCVNHGFRYFAFTSMKDAEKWLVN